MLEAEPGDSKLIWLTVRLFNINHKDNQEINENTFICIIKTLKNLVEDDLFYLPRIRIMGVYT